MTANHAATSKELVPANAEFPAEIKAEAVGLALALGNVTEAARQIKERYPNRYPSRQLISRWCNLLQPDAMQRIRDEKREAFEDGLVEMGIAALEKMQEHLESAPDNQVPISAGIAMDKTIKLLDMERREKRGPIQVGKFVIVLGGQAQPDDYIEVEKRA